MNKLMMPDPIIGWTKRTLQNCLVVYFFGLIFTLSMLYNYVIPLDAIIENRDYVLQLWNLWEVNEAITSGQNPYFTELQYYPVGAHLGRHVLSPGFSPVTFLVQKLSGHNELYPLYAGKIILLLSYSLILYFSYLTLGELGISLWPAILLAVAYTFGDFYINNIVRFHIISGFFIPLIAFVIIRLIKHPP